MKQYLLPRTGNFYKVNMHSHSCLSDGKQTPEELKEAYTAHGYSAIAFTEHEGLFDLSHLSDEGFVAITSYEYALGDYSNPPFCFYEGKPTCFSHVEQMHLNIYAKEPHNNRAVCFNPKYIGEKIASELGELKYYGDGKFEKEFTVECFNTVIAEANANGFFVVYNHPNWSLNTYPTYSRLEGLTGIEIVNGASDRSSDMDYAPYVYDQMARAGKRMVCVGGDDNHGSVHFFRAWTMVKTDELSYSALIDGIEKGNCYASTGPEIYELYYDGSKVHVRCSDAAGVYYTTAGRRKGCKLAESDALPVNAAAFTVDPTDYYFRITVKDRYGRHANSRIYYLDELEIQPVAKDK